MRVTNSHVYFWGSYLSNFFWQPFTAIIGKSQIEFHTSEQFYMAVKAAFFDDEVAFHQILDAPDAKAAKAIGRTVKNFDADKWDMISYKVMLKGVEFKFDAGEKIRQKLFETGDRILVEASPNDKIWGVGLHEDDDLILDEKNWTGENRLGKVLMEVRTTLKKKYNYEPTITLF